MQADDLTSAQCKQMQKRLRSLAGFFVRLRTRLTETEFPPTDPLPIRTSKALDSVCELGKELKIRAEGGTGTEGGAKLPEIGQLCKGNSVSDSKIADRMRLDKQK